MDYMRCREPVSPRDFRHAGFTAAELPALREQPGPGCPVNGSVDAASAKETPPGRVDDGVDRQSGDVSLDHLDARRLLHLSAVPDILEASGSGGRDFRRAAGGKEFEVFNIAGG